MGHGGYGARGSLWRLLGTSGRLLDPLGILGILLLITGWWGLSRWLPPVQAPSPLAVWHELSSRFWHDQELEAAGITSGGFAGAVVYTALNVVIAIAIGSIGGIVVGLASARNWAVRDLFDPILLVFGTVPILVGAPFLLLWFGTTNLAQISLVTFYVAMVMAFYARRAAENLPPVHEEYAATLGARKFRVFRDVLAPGVAPELIAGVRIALASAWGLQVIAEQLGAPLGVGRVIDVIGPTYNTAALFAIILLMGVVAVVADLIVFSFSKWVIRWK
jgi:ABC-type nitrate/sulfonate/bicarbonate transport system permease component